MATKTKKPRPKKPKQGYLPDMEPPRIKELDDAAEIYDDTKTERVKRTKDETEAKDNLITKMIAHGLNIYENDTLRVELTDKHNVKTRKKTQGGTDGEFVPEE